VATALDRADYSIEAPFGAGTFFFLTRYLAIGLASRHHADFSSHLPSWYTTLAGITDMSRTMAWCCSAVFPASYRLLNCPMISSRFMTR
jgi:hypothetical protein